MRTLSAEYQDFIGDIQHKLTNKQISLQNTPWESNIIVNAFTVKVLLQIIKLLAIPTDISDKQTRLSEKAKRTKERERNNHKFPGW